MLCPNCKKDVHEFPGSVVVCNDCGAFKIMPDGSAEPCDIPGEAKQLADELIEESENEDINIVALDEQLEPVASAVKSESGIFVRFSL